MVCECDGTQTLHICRFAKIHCGMVSVEGIVGMRMQIDKILECHAEHLFSIFCIYNITYSFNKKA